MGLHEYGVVKMTVEAPKLTQEQRDKVIKDWYESKQQLIAEKARLSPIEADERVKRAALKTLFSEIVEGSKNVIELGNGYSLQLKQTYSRNVDNAALQSMLPELKEAQVPVDMLYKAKYELDMAIYRRLTKEQKELVDQTFVLKEDMATAELKVPKTEDQ